jgi:hypothetical protein
LDDCRGGLLDGDARLSSIGNAVRDEVGFVGFPTSTRQLPGAGKCALPER